MSSRAGSYKPRTPGSVKEAVDMLFEQAGGRKRVAELFDLGPSQIAALTDERTHEHLSCERAAGLTSPRAPVMAELFSLRAGGVFLPIAPEDADLGGLLADDAKAHGDTVSEVVAALRDGKMDKKEAGIALGKVRRELQALTALHQAIKTRTEQD